MSHSIVERLKARERQLAVALGRRNEVVAAARHLAHRTWFECGQVSFRACLARAGLVRSRRDLACSAGRLAAMATQLARWDREGPVGELKDTGVR